jgi:DNA polymerase-3 subunit epsilon
MSRSNPQTWSDIFITTIDTVPIECIRPSDTDRPTWCIYAPGSYRPEDYLGTLHALDTAGLWHVQATGERHASFADAVRALRRPPTWPRERARAAWWARRLLADPALLIIDVQTTGLTNPFAAQIAATDGSGTLILNELLDPQAEFEPEASTLHGLTEESTRNACTFNDLLPVLAELFHGRHLVAYSTFDQAVIARELHRHLSDPVRVRAWLSSSRWHDAIPPISTWTGLWSTRYHAYRHVKLGSHYAAAANCHLLLRRLQQLADHWTES